MDPRASSGQKRARTDGFAGGEGDWTCPKCGNVNFSFRTTCNMRKCGTSKPADVTQRGMGGPPFLAPVYDQAQAARYMGGPGAPAGVPLGMPSSYGAAMPIHAAPASGVPYNFGVPLNAPGAYNPMTMPSSYGPLGAVVGGPAYGVAPIVDGYGMAINMGQPQMPGSRSLMYADENGIRKRRGGPDGSSEGDWICPKCGNVNFAFRETCNMRKCGASKPTEPTSRTEGPPPAGSWKCEQCGNVNYPFRTKCNRKNCGADRPTNTKASPQSKQ
eukprot:c19441_g1_i2 orf=207-1022(+)